MVLEELTAPESKMISSRPWRIWFGEAYKFMRHTLFRGPSRKLTPLEDDETSEDTAVADQLMDTATLPVNSDERWKERLVQSHRMECLGRLTSGITHEFHN